MCFQLIVSDLSDLSAMGTFRQMGSVEADSFRGRCYHGDPVDPDDGPPPSCDNGGGGCAFCPGMPSWTVSEPFINLWIRDMPLTYKSAIGPAVELKLIWRSRVGVNDLGSRLGTVIRGPWGPDSGDYWACSWFSSVKYDNDVGTSASVILPDGSEAQFAFAAAGTTNSDINFRTNFKLEKRFAGTNVTGFYLHYPNGTRQEYTNNYSASLFFLTGDVDERGDKTTFSYVDGKFLNRVTAADGTTFQITQEDSGGGTYSNLVSVVASYGASVTLGYAETNFAPNAEWNDNSLSSITDAAGIKTYLYLNRINASSSLIVSPYGTTTFTYAGGEFGQAAVSLFDRYLKVTFPDSSSEVYANLTGYLNGVDWPNWSGGQIPDTSTSPVNSLDTNDRQGRNSFYWNPQQWATISKDPAVDAFNWAEFKKGRIRHWLTSTSDSYTHWDALSWEQAPSPDGSAEGIVTWYDYAGKPAGENFKRGSQVNPSIIAKVMPDGNTWYQHFQRNSLGKATNMIERFGANGSPSYRTNVYYYDANGINMIGHLGPLRHLEEGFAYDSTNQVLRSTNALWETTSRAYDSKHRLATTTLPSGHLSTYTYYGSGNGANTDRLQKVVDSMGGVNYRTNSYTWNSQGEIATQTDERGLTTTFAYDYLNRVKTKTFPDGTGETNRYHLFTGESFANSTGGTNIIERTAFNDRLGNLTRYTYDGSRRVSLKVDPLGTTNAFGYCPCGSVSTITNGWKSSAPEVTTNNFDYQGRPTSIVGPGSTTITHTYDTAGRITKTTDGLRSTTNVFDNLGRTLMVLGHGGVLSSNLFDRENRITASTDQNGVVVTNLFDDLGRVLKKGVNGQSGVESWGYTANYGTATKYTNQLGNTWSYAFDLAGRKTNEITTGISTNGFSYDASGNLVTLVDGKLQTTTWGYDSYNRSVSKKLANNQTNLIYAYDANHRLTNRWSQQKGNTRYLYDKNGNLTNVVYASSPELKYRYNLFNRLTNMVDGIGTTVFTYHAGGNLAGEDGPWANDTISYVYTNGNRRHSLSLLQPTGTWTDSIAYDGMGRPQSLTSKAGTFTYTYKNGSAFWTNLALPNSASIVRSNDAIGRIVGSWLKTTYGSNADINVYNYDVANQRTKHTRGDLGHYGYGYDGAGQVKTANATNSAGAVIAGEKRGYFYDAAQNVNYVTNNAAVSTFGVDNLNQLTTYAGSTDTYDSNGNVLTEPAFSRTYTWTDENQLASVSSSAGVTLTYDGLGRLRKRVESSGGETRYVYDGFRVIQERTSSDVPTVAYTRGWDLSGSFQGAGGIGGMLARSHSYSSGNWGTTNFYHADGNGNITHMVNSAQLMVASYKYDPFGTTIASSGTLANANTYRFSSKEFLVNWNVYYYGYRYYHPGMQRWLNRDPIQEMGGINLYAYVENSPLNFVDPLGLALDSINSNAAHPEAAELLAEVAADQAAKKAAQEAAKQLLKQCRKLGDKELKKHVGDIHKAKDVMKKQFGDKLKGDTNFDVMVDKAGNAVLKGNKSGTVVETGVAPSAFAP